MFSDFFVIEGWWRKDIEIFQATALQQLGDGTFESDAEVRMRAERGEAGSVGRVKQHHADNRVFAAQRAIVSKDRETFGFQLIDGLHHTWITRHDLCRNFWQADALSDDAVFNVTLEDFRQCLNARFVRRVACGHPVRDIQVADDIHRDIDGFAIGLAGERQAANAAFVVARLQIDQHAGGQLIVRIVKCAQTRIQQTFRHFIVFGQREPFLIWIVDEWSVSDGFAQPKVSKKVVGGQTLEIFTKSRGQRRFFGCPFAVGETQRALFITDMY